VQEKRNTNIKEREYLLIQHASAGNAEAFGKLYDMHINSIYRYVYYHVGNTADAEDITQKVFLKAWQAITRYRKKKSPFLAWLMSISHNVVIDFYRTKKDKVEVDDKTLDDDIKSSPEQAAESLFEQERLRKAILKLGGVMQQVLVLRLIEGFKFLEIASLLGKSEGAVRVILHRALVKLKKILEKENY